MPRLHLLSCAELARDLAENRLSEFDKACYLAAGWLIFSAIGYSTLTYSNTSRSWMGIIEFASVFVIALFGFFFCYSRNGGANGESFVVRFTCLLVPAAVRTHIIVWGGYYAVGWCFFVVTPQLTFSSQEGADIYIAVSRNFSIGLTYLAVVICQLIPFLLVGRYLGKIAGGKKQQSGTG